jgi:arabinose-5-phosphate isomerase
LGKKPAFSTGYPGRCSGAAPKITKNFVPKHDHILQIARQTVHIEAQALQRLEASLGATFLDCVQAIYDSGGRVVVTGIGKSALVGRKIAATLNSTGTPALFMHAADAIHGDLGMIQSQDVVLCLSKSGETAEIKVLIPLVRHLGYRLIAMTANPDSTLGRQADCCLLTPVDQEADPNNLAPTASTTTQMALGDALATALLALRGFGPQDFAAFHPGGALGKQLYLRVADLYPRNAVPRVRTDTSVQETILEMTSKCLGATVVLDEADQIVGIITDGDLRRTLEKTPDIYQLCARDLMNPRPKTIAADTVAIHALAQMRQHSISQLVVVDATGTYLGIVHLHDLVREGLI